MGRLRALDFGWTTWSRSVHPPQFSVHWFFSVPTLGVGEKKGVHLLSVHVPGVSYSNPHPSDRLGAETGVNGEWTSSAGEDRCGRQDENREVSVTGKGEVPSVAIALEPVAMESVDPEAAAP